MSIESFGQDNLGRSAVLVTISNHASNMRASITNFGASLVSLSVPDKSGLMADVCLGFDQLQDYMTRSGHLGSTVGRYANRIAGASFVLNGKVYNLEANNGRNTLHGGRIGFSKRFWEYQNPGVNQAIFTYVSPHMEEGFPGTMTVTVRYLLSDEGGLSIEYKATSDQDTIINLTNHTYFNLSGQGTIHGQILQVNADKFLEAGIDLIPTGKLLNVCGTPYDLRTSRCLGDMLTMTGTHAMFDNAKGYDVAYVIKGSGEREAAILFDPVSRRRMRVITDQPGMQLYSGQGLNVIGKNDIHYQPYSGIALETQHHPNSVNMPDMPSTILCQGSTFRSKTTYLFDTL